MVTARRDQQPIGALYERSMARPGLGGRRVLRGRMTLDALLRDEHSDSEVDVVRLHSIEEIRRVFEGLGRSIRTEILTMLPNSDAAAGGMRASREADLELLRRGVGGLLIYEPRWTEDPAVRAEIQVRVEAGAKARVVDRVPHRLTIFDRRVAVVPIEPTLVTPGALVVRERGMVASLTALFTSVWRQSVEFTTYEAGARGGCGPRERQVLELMSRGSTDDAAAREMEVSVRTYRRYVADVMSSLGAGSRFQAGVLAVERGWL